MTLNYLYYMFRTLSPRWSSCLDQVNLIAIYLGFPVYSIHLQIILPLQLYYIMILGKKLYLNEFVMINFYIFFGVKLDKKTN